MKEKETNRNYLIKRFIIIPIIIILVAISIIYIYSFVITFDGFLNTDIKMTREEVIEILEKGKQYANYYYSPTTKDGDEDCKVEYYVKDGIEKQVLNGKTVSWFNQGNSEQIYLKNIEGKDIAWISTKNNENINKNHQHGFDYSLIAEPNIFNTDFEFLGEKKVEEKNCILVKVWNRDDIKSICTKFLIDKESGLIIERRDFWKEGLLITTSISNRNLKLDCVTNQDVARPDLSNYQIIY